MVVAIMKGYIIFVIILMLLYTARHFYFTIVRLLGRQRLYYNDILTDRMKSISVLIPMHNEEQVLSNVLDSLLKCEYDRDRLEIIPINDNSTDRTREMLDEYHRSELQYRRNQKKRLKMKLRNLRDDGKMSLDHFFTEIHICLIFSVYVILIVKKI